MPQLFDCATTFDAWFGAPLQALQTRRPAAAAAGAAGRKRGGAASAAAATALPPLPPGAGALGEEECLLVAGRLHAVLRPFMLRRLKEQVAAELPAKARPLAAARPQPPP